MRFFGAAPDDYEGGLPGVFGEPSDVPGIPPPPPDGGVSGGPAGTPSRHSEGDPGRVGGGGRPAPDPISGSAPPGTGEQPIPPAPATEMPEPVAQPDPGSEDLEDPVDGMPEAPGGPAAPPPPPPPPPPSIPPPADPLAMQGTFALPGSIGARPFQSPRSIPERDPQVGPSGPGVPFAGGGEEIDDSMAERIVSGLRRR